MRILVVAPRFPVLSETFVIEQVKALIAAGADVEVLSFAAGDSEVTNCVRFQFDVRTLRPLTLSTLDKVKVLTAFALRAPFSGLGRRSFMSAVRSVCSGLPGTALNIALMFDRGSLGSYDVILAHFGQTGVAVHHLRRAGLLSGALAIVFHGFDVTIHTVIQKYLRHYRQLFEHGDLFLPVSNVFGDRLQSWGCSSQQIYVGRMGINLDDFPFEFRPPAPGRLRLLFVGRLTEKKGTEFAIRAMAMLPASIHLTIVGGGDLEVSLRLMIEELAVGERVSLLGKQPHAEVSRLLREADLFLLPSIVAENGDMEGVPVALMEAMASGVVTISTRHSGIPELIDDRYSGFLVDEKDSLALAAVIRDIADSAYDLAAIARNARRKIEVAFNSTREANALVATLAGYNTSDHAVIRK
ncbi:hypothetical protein AYM40_33895 [Paraburkholderia phytofirmans OLGA172]|uniref:Glycosyl transferase family 1 domain-containing protein n=1 Tax=Paraburkholderia phytofirmans OLGA172 TaxID=1417228 RepID=A0A160FW25_9BURK|nr:glycosyltransferase [Paraburkholderia phytofirmans]ANB77108.1 hypothetical protein AYM40_33895 [Paraburkholderia phytofirmans OLGA172]